MDSEAYFMRFFRFLSITPSHLLKNEKKELCSVKKMALRITPAGGELAEANRPASRRGARRRQLCSSNGTYNLFQYEEVLRLNILQG